MAEAGERFQDDSHVDESRLKLPENVTFDGTTQTGEEAEDVTYETRARYYRMRGGEVRCGLRGWLACVGLRDSHCYVAFQWKERGTGDVRFLRDRKSGVIRIVLRQDGTKHVRVNHNLHESLTLHQYQDSDKTLMYSVVGTPWLGRCPCLPDANLTSVALARRFLRRRARRREVRLQVPQRRCRGRVPQQVRGLVCRGGQRPRC